MRENVGQYDWEESEGHLSDMENGTHHDINLPAGQVGELAAVELGAAGHGSFSEFYRMALGGVADSQLRTKAARVDGDIQADDGTGVEVDAPAGTQVRIRLTDKQRDTTYSKTRWYGKDEVETTEISALPLLQFAGFDDADFIREGRVVVVEVKNPSSAFIPRRDRSTLKFPFIGGS